MAGGRFTMKQSKELADLSNFFLNEQRIKKILRIIGCVLCILADSVTILALFFLISEVITITKDEEK